VLKDKAGEKAHLALGLDLRNPRKIEPTRKYKEEENDIKLYEPKYIIGKLKLLDETGMEFILSDEIRAIRLIRRRGGKTKIKHKSKVSRHYFIRLIFPKKYYVLKNGAAVNARVEETPDAIICKLKVKTKTAQIEEIVSLGEFLNSVQELYGLVRPRDGASLPEGTVQPAAGETAKDATAAGSVTDESLTAVPFMVWGGTYFTAGDYSGFSRETGYYSDDTGSDTFLDS
jgi:hypothetical protein